MLGDEELAKHMGEGFDEWKDFDGMGHDFSGLGTHDFSQGPELGLSLIHI